MDKRTIIRNIPKQELIFDKITKKRFWFILFPVALPIGIIILYIFASGNALKLLNLLFVFLGTIVTAIIFLGVSNIKFKETGFDILKAYINCSNVIYLERGRVINASNSKKERNKKNRLF